MERVARMMPYLLVAVSGILVVWGLLGLLEYVVPILGIGLQNGNFPPGLQFLHFFSILVTGAVFIAGYRARWRPTPFVTITMYAVLATICFIETVDFGAFGGGPERFAVMLIEYAVYVGLSAYLLRSTTMRRHFSGETALPART